MENKKTIQDQQIYHCLADLLYLEEEEINADSNLRELGLDSLRTILLFERLGLGEYGSLYQNFMINPTVSTLLSGLESI